MGDSELKAQVEIVIKTISLLGNSMKAIIIMKEMINIVFRIWI